MGLRPCLLPQVPASSSQLSRCDLVLWCLPGSSPSCHHHCSGCPAPWHCTWWLSVLQRPSEGSALSPALGSLMAVTPQPHHRGCWHPSPQLTLATLQLAELGLGAEPCLPVLLGRRRGCGAGTSGDAEGMALLLFLTAYLPRSPPAAPTRCGLVESCFTSASSALLCLRWLKRPL